MNDVHITALKSQRSTMQRALISKYAELNKAKTEYYQIKSEYLKMYKEFQKTDLKYAELTQNFKKDSLSKELKLISSKLPKEKIQQIVDKYEKEIK